MRIADYIVARLAFRGVTDAFVVVGGAAMHLDDAFAENADMRVSYMHHEQACSMAAEGYARVDWRPAAVVVTAGPGVINALNGVFGAYTDSIPMIVISGQVRSDTVSVDAELRQLGDQEVQTLDLVSTMTTWRHRLKSGDDLRVVVDDAYFAATGGRSGPVWLDVPVDLQAVDVDLDPTDPAGSTSPRPGGDLLPQAEEICQRLSGAKRPVILAGTGVRASNTQESLVAFAEALDIPVMTAWTHDLLPTEHQLNFGRPGTIGTRDANLILQQADAVLVLGSRLNIRQVSYNWRSFVSGADLIHIDIDEAELTKPYLNQSLRVVADLKDMLPALANSARAGGPNRSAWLSWCRNIQEQYAPTWSDYPARSSGINPYHLVMKLGDHVRSGDVVVCGNATACVVPFQVLSLPPNVRMFSNSGSASMGYDLPAALGAARAVAGQGRRVICLAGDGSLMMNLQELETLSKSGLDIALVVLANEGYLSIRQTQANFFGRFNGCGPSSGLSFPDFSLVGEAFGLATTSLSLQDSWEESLANFMEERGPRLCVAALDPHQEFEPRLRSRSTANGISTPVLDDMYPHLPQDQLEAIRTSAPDAPEVPLQARPTMGEKSV